MSATRNTRGKKLKAAQTFAVYGTSAAGATEYGLTLLGICIPIPSVLRYAISAIVGFIFGCCGGCNEYNQPDENERRDQDLAEIKQELHEVKDDIHRHHDDEAHSTELTLFSEPRLSPVKSSSGLFFRRTERQINVETSYQNSMTLYGNSPSQMDMDEHKEHKEHKESSGRKRSLTF